MSIFNKVPKIIEIVYHPNHLYLPGDVLADIFHLVRLNINYICPINTELTKY